MQQKDNSLKQVKKHLGVEHQKRRAAELAAKEAKQAAEAAGTSTSLSGLPPLPPGMVFVGEQSLREQFEELDALRASLKAETARADTAAEKKLIVLPIARPSRWP